MERGARTHKWLYSNTSEVWFCERCHRWDRTGKEVADDDPCQMARPDLAAEGWVLVADSWRWAGAGTPPVVAARPS